MGILMGLLGNATEIDIEKVEKDLAHFLTPQENVEKAFQLIRDLFVFTDKRLILIDKQGISGKKVEYRSIPYKSISQFSVESAGHFDLDSELKIWVKGSHVPYTKQFKSSSNILEIQRTIAVYVLR